MQIIIEFYSLRKSSYFLRCNIRITNWFQPVDGLRYTSDVSTLVIAGYEGKLITITETLFGKIDQDFGFWLDIPIFKICSVFYTLQEGCQLPILFLLENNILFIEGPI